MTKPTFGPVWELNVFDNLVGFGGLCWVLVECMTGHWDWWVFAIALIAFSGIPAYKPSKS